MKSIQSSGIDHREDASHHPQQTDNNHESHHQLLLQWCHSDQLHVADHGDSIRHHHSCRSSQGGQVAIDVLKYNGNKGATEGHHQTYDNVVSVAAFNVEHLIYNLSWGENIDGNYEEDGHHEGQLAYRHRDCLDRGHHHWVYGSSLDVLSEQKVARHSDQKIAQYLHDMDSSEYFIYSFLGWVSEVFSQGEHQVMSHVAKHEGGKSLNLL